ncbi:hypothetical protein BN128_4487 [Cronobacter sakazakii 696]|nr:hypothetical protein BN128_4487 [Cronobacter sakazakii 696]
MPRRLQRAVEQRQVIAFRHQRGKPQHLTGEQLALGDHLRNKPDLAALAPQLLLLAAEVKPAVSGKPQIAALARVARFCRVGGVMERRVAQRGVVTLILVNNAVENRAGGFLAAQADRAVEPRIGIDNRARATDRLIAGVGAGKTPAIFMLADQRINAVGTNADIQHARLRGQCAAIAFGKQIGEMMNIIRAARYGRAEETVRNVPLPHAVKVRQQRLIKGSHRLRIGEINCRLTCGRRADKSAKRRTALCQRVKIIAAVVAVAWVQARFAVHRLPPVWARTIPADPPLVNKRGKI